MKGCIKILVMYDINCTTSSRYSRYGTCRNLDPPDVTAEAYV